MFEQAGGSDLELAAGQGLLTIDTLADDSAETDGGCSGTC